MNATDTAKSGYEAPEPKAYEPSMEEILASIRRIIADDQSLPGRALQRDGETNLRAALEGAQARGDVGPDGAMAVVAPPERPVFLRTPTPAEPPAVLYRHPAASPQTVHQIQSVYEQSSEAQHVSASRPAAPVHHGHIAAPQFAMPDSPVSMLRPSEPQAVAAPVQSLQPAPVQAPQPQVTPAPVAAVQAPQMQAPATQTLQAQVPQAQVPQAQAPQTHAAQTQGPSVLQASVPQAAMPVHAAEIQPQPEPVHAPQVQAVSPAQAAPAMTEAASADQRLADAAGVSSLFSEATSQAVSEAFNRLAATRFVENNEAFKDMVREMIHPLLKSWLDDNLPDLVERLVKGEIERVSRGGNR